MISRVLLRRLTALVVFVSALVSAAPACWAQKTLAWKFKRGSVTNLLIEQDTSIQMEAAGGGALAPIQTQQLQLSNITWTITEVSPDGQASIEQLVKRVQLDLKSPAGNFQIDTDNNQPLSGIGESMAKGIRPLVGARFVVKAKSNGEISEVIIPDDVQKNLNELSAAGLREIAANGSLKFPAKAIDVGETWPAQYELEMPPFGKLIVSTTYQYLGEETVGGRILDRIKATTAVKVADALSNSGLKMKSQESGGLIWFDNTRGSIDHSEFKQEMSINVVKPSTDPVKPSSETKQTVKQTMKLKYAPQL
jgi:hypothetical protein